MPSHKARLAAVQPKRDGTAIWSGDAWRRLGQGHNTSCMGLPGTSGRAAQARDLVTLALDASSRARAASNGLARDRAGRVSAVGEEGLGNRKSRSRWPPPFLDASVVAVTADRLPRANFAQNSATTSQIAEGLVFASKAGNKPSKHGW